MSASTYLPRDPRQAGNTVIDRMAYGASLMRSWRRSAISGNPAEEQRPIADATINTAENVTVRPAVITVRRTAVWRRSLRRSLSAEPAYDEQPVVDGDFCIDQRHHGWANSQCTGPVRTA